MSNGRRDFEPMLNIPSMEELDRQWQELQAESDISQSSLGQNRSKARFQKETAMPEQREKNHHTSKKAGKEKKKHKRFILL